MGVILDLGKTIEQVNVHGVPRHRGDEGNEKTSELTRKGAWTHWS